ncbi:hypothetical protein EVAR_41560_1 [Eumeta japonica]|uniref:Uncharacterized protein n=1 Tax=Eumeta variegata TaxID=151549 RepID=A0A4C1Y1Z5_EUMVA|nr:hypothetical protein EVAR_41560_1 [Eumeta japonica]
MSDFQGLMMELEGSDDRTGSWTLVLPRSLTVFGLVDIVMEYTLTMIGFQGLITELEVWKLHHQTVKFNRGQNTFRGNSNKPKYDQTTRWPANYTTRLANTRDSTAILFTPSLTARSNYLAAPGKDNLRYGKEDRNN